MLSEAQLNALKVGDVVSTVPMLPGLTNEPIKAKLTSKEDGFWLFDLSLYGVFLGEASAEKLENGQLEWNEL